MARLSTSDTLTQLRAYESRNVTFIDPDGSWPVVWDRAEGMHVWDPEGKQYLDLTAAFGVAATGHANPHVVRAAQRQLKRLPHAMGDVHPHPSKVRLARELSRLTFERWSASAKHSALLTGKTLFGNSGFEAVEAALKTARLAAGKPGIIAFENAYHGLGYGALNATHRSLFRRPFRDQLGEFGQFVHFPENAASLKRMTAQIRRLCRRHSISAILAEPIQGRGGFRIPPPEFLPRLRQLADETGALLVLDEIYTGMGRTGHWFACEATGTIPDVICLGKALTGGFPLSACVGKAEIMDAAWPPSAGEAIHTSTFLGNPVGCAMALAQIKEIQETGLVSHSAQLGKYLLSSLSRLMPPPGLNFAARGIGLMAGLEITDKSQRPATRFAMQVIKAMLQRGFILLPEGDQGNVIGFTPPLIISREQIRRTIGTLKICLFQSWEPGNQVSASGPA